MTNFTHFWNCSYDSSKLHDITITNIEKESLSSIQKDKKFSFHDVITENQNLVQYKSERDNA